MLPNEEFALACRAYYEEQGLIVDKTNGEFAHCPLPRSMGDKGYYLLWEHHQHQGLLQSKDVGRCCFWTPNTKRWLLTADYFPDNYFELWDIFEHFAKENTARMLETFNNPEVVSKRLQAIREAKRKMSPERRKEVFAKAHEATSKQVEVSFPDGSKKVFSSASGAANFLGAEYTTLCKWCKTETPPMRGKFKFFSFHYL